MAGQKCLRKSERRAKRPRPLRPRLRRWVSAKIPVYVQREADEVARKVVSGARRPFLLEQQLPVKQLL